MALQWMAGSPLETNRGLGRCGHRRGTVGTAGAPHGQPPQPRWGVGAVGRWRVGARAKEWADGPKCGDHGALNGGNRPAGMHSRAKQPTSACSTPARSDLPSSFQTWWLRTRVLGREQAWRHPWMSSPNTSQSTNLKRAVETMLHCGNRYPGSSPFWLWRNHQGALKHVWQAMTSCATFQH